MSPNVPCADPAAAVCGYLAAHVGDMLAQVDGRPAVFRPKLPQTQDQNMPQACIVVRPAGGYKMFGLGTLPVADPNLDIICYGSADQEAYNVARSAGVALRELSQSVWENTLLYWARVAGGPLPLPDQITLWPAVWIGVQVMHAEAVAAGTEA